MYQAVKNYFYIAIFLLVIIIALLLFLKNDQTVTVDYLIASFDISLAALVFISFSIGACLGVIAWIPKLFVLKNALLKLQKKKNLSVDTTVDSG